MADILPASPRALASAPGELPPRYGHLASSRTRAPRRRAVPTRGHADDALEVARQVALVREPDLRRNVGGEQPRSQQGPRSPHAFLEQPRVRRAQSLLRTGLLPADVAAEVGFADQSHLTRHFKRIVGVTPGRYRAGARGASS